MITYYMYFFGRIAFNKLFSIIQIGDVFEIRHELFPWKVLYPVVATDGWYETNASAIKEIIENVLARLNSSDDIKSLAMSVLGAGYGDMDIESFMDIVESIAVPSCLTRAVIVVHSEELYGYACKRISQLENVEMECLDG